MNYLACRFCIASRGLRGVVLEQLPKTEEELFDHIETVHHMPVVRNDETEAEAIARFLTKHPNASDCENCRAAGAPWMRPSDALPAMQTPGS